jgi:hypothetical protein
LSESDFYTPTDLDKLRMENELLEFEVRFLRAHLGLSGGQGSSTSLQRLSRLEEAERDLVLLLRRMSGSRAGRVLRLNSNFRALEERYLLSPTPQDPSAPNRLEYLEGAERDLILLLRRMGRPPLGRVFRLKREFRTLEQRYL